MSGNTIPPKPPLPANSEIFAAKTSEPNASNKTERSNAGDALGGRRCAVGPGEKREKAQSAAAAVKSIFTSLSNGFKSVLYSAATLVKPLASYIFRSSDADTELQPKKAMKQASGAIAQGISSVDDFLHSNSVLKDRYRRARDSVNPPQSTLDSLERQASDTFTDIKDAGKNLLSEAQGFFKKLF